MLKYSIERASVTSEQERNKQRQKDRKTERQKERKTERQKDIITQNQTRSNLTLHKPKLTELYVP